MEFCRRGRVIPILTKITDLKPSLTKLLPRIEFKEIYPANKEEDLQLLQNSEIVIGDPNLICPFLYEMNNTKWIQGTWAGVDLYANHIDHNKPKLPFQITRFSDPLSFGCQMGEYLISQIVIHERDYFKIHKNQSEKIYSWEGNIWTFRIFADLNVGILGFGVIGKEIVRILKAFHAKVWVLARTLPREDERSPFVDEYRTMNDIAELLSSCDYICNVLPSTSETKGLLGNGILQHCSASDGGKGAVFVNIGRGSIISEKDLLEALNKNWISGAILDVFETEPLPPTSPLWLMPKVTITPHVSGVTRAQDVAKLFARNLKLYESGQPLEYVYNVEKGY